jgi:hypothetical protein
VKHHKPNLKSYFVLFLDILIEIILIEIICVWLLTIIIKMASMTIDQLNSHLETRSYITGFSFSADDTAAYSKLCGAPNPKTHPYAYRWALHIAALSGTQ